MSTREKTRRGLDADVPQTGIAADAYNVAATSSILKGHAPPADGWLAPARHAVALHRISGKLHRIAERECSEDLTCHVCGGDGEGPSENFTGEGRAAAQRLGVKGGTCDTCAGTGSTLGKREARLREDAREIAAHYGLRVYFQTDPRGCSLYLIDPEIVPKSVALVPGEPLEPHVYHGEEKSIPALATLQERWIEANYNRGHAVTRLGR